MTMYLGLDKHTLVQATGTYVAKPLPVPVNAPPFSLTTDEYRIFDRCREHPSWRKALLVVIDRSEWGEATLVIKDGEIVMVKGLREDVKISDG